MAERTMEKGPGAELEAVDTRKSSVLTVLEEYNRQFKRHGVMSSTLQARLSNLYIGQKLQIEGRLDRYNSLRQYENQIDFNGIVEVTAVLVDGRSGHLDPYLIPILEVVDDKGEPYPMILKTPYYDRGPDWKFAPEIDVTDRAMSHQPAAADR